MRRITCLLVFTGLALASGAALAEKPRKGLNAAAVQELREAGVDKYLGQFSPILAEDVGDGWTKHTFDSLHRH